MSISPLDPQKKRQSASHSVHSHSSSSAVEAVIEDSTFESNTASDATSSNDVAVGDATLDCQPSCGSAGGTCSAVDCYSSNTQ